MSNEKHQDDERHGETIDEPVMDGAGEDAEAGVDPRKGQADPSPHSAPRQGRQERRTVQPVAALPVAPRRHRTPER